MYDTHFNILHIIITIFQLKQFWKSRPIEKITRSGFKIWSSGVLYTGFEQSHNSGNFNKIDEMFY